MLKKIVGFALVIGGLMSILLLTIPRPVQISWYEGFTSPKPKDFIAGQQTTCVGVNYQFTLSKQKVGYPLSHVVTTNYDSCSSPGKSGVAKSIFFSSLKTWQFYANWLMLSLLWFGLALIATRNKSIIKS